MNNYPFPCIPMYQNQNTSNELKEIITLLKKIEEKINDKEMNIKQNNYLEKTDDYYIM